MYFESRAQAGAELAKILAEKYRFEDCAVVALSDGGVLVGEQIAAQLHCILTMLLVETIEVPGENMAFGAVSESGAFTYNGMLSAGEVDEYTTEFHGYLEDQKREAFSRINRLLGDGGIISHEMLREHTVILVDDGLDSRAAIDVALEFLKPIKIARLVVAAPVASVSVVDKLHTGADELHILDVKANYLGTNHYYTTNNVPSHEDTVVKINQIVLNWR